MIKSIFAPRHPNALKALLDELFADALKYIAIPEADVVFGSADSEYGGVALEIGLPP